MGSGGGSPGLPLAVALPSRDFTLLEAERRKCAFLERFARELPNVEVVWGRAEERHSRLTVSRSRRRWRSRPSRSSSAHPLVARGGAVVLWLGETADRGQVARAAALVGCSLESDSDGLVLLRKVEPTPAGFPRRPGVAKKRPLA